MQHYKAPDNSLHVIEPEFAHLLPIGCVPITEAEADAIRAAQPAPPVPPVPQSVTMRQARLALLSAGLLAAVNAAIATMPGVAGEAARIEWEYAQTVERDSPLVAGLTAALNLTQTQIDDLFALAATL